MSVLPGLCSVTFRSLKPDEIIALARANAIAGIEWGADIHLPPGDLAAARSLRERSQAAGVAAISYGSYIYAGDHESRNIEPVIATAAALGTGHLRVWAGPRKVASRDCTVTQWADSVAALRQIADLAYVRDIAVSLEYHPDSLTDDIESTCRLLAEVDRPNLFSLWQPRPGISRALALGEIERLRADLSHLHVFCWNAAKERLALEACDDFWRTVLASIPRGRWKGQRYAFLEFVRGDDPAQLARDAASLRAMLAALDAEDGTLA